MSTSTEITRDRWSTVGWWSIWAIAFIFSLLPPIVHHWTRIDDIIEPLRYRLTHFLPAELLLLRKMGEWAHWIPAALILVLVVGIYWRRLRNTSIVVGVLISAVFSSIYAAFCLIVVSMYLVSYTQIVLKNQEAQQAAPRNR
jgi:MFS family permease